MSTFNCDYDSNFGDEAEVAERERTARKRRRDEGVVQASKAKAGSSVFSEEAARDEGRRQRHKLLALNAYDRHKLLVNEYLLQSPGDADKILSRDTSKDRTDADVIRENHRFLWEDDDGDGTSLTWEQRLAKKYWEKLFHEYCICDLSRYRENKVAMRFQTELEVRSGKGQFACGARKCQESERLRTWEVNFAYNEEGDKKNALVKLRLCPECSYRLNYHHKKKEITRKKEKKRKEGKKKRKKQKKERNHDHSSSSSGESSVEGKEGQSKAQKGASDIWKEPIHLEQDKSREEDFDEYLEDMFL